MNETISKNLKGDITGGISSALLSLPGSMAYGSLVFAPLGPEYIKTGIIAGLISFIIINIFSAPLSGVKILNSGPFSLSSFMLVTALASISVILKKEGIEDPDTIMTVLFFLVALAGLIQALFGLLGLGELTKFIPYPVLAGLFNGTAILIFSRQIFPMLGLEGKISLDALINQGGQIQPCTLIVGSVTVLTIWLGGKITKKFPAPVLGILMGTLLYYGFSQFLPKTDLGPIIGYIPSSVPLPHYAPAIYDLFQGPAGEVITGKIFTFLALATGLAAIISLRTLIASVAADNLTNDNSMTNRELVAQGLGNIVVSFFGGISAAGSVSRTLGNYFYGGRTVFSRLVSGLTMLSILLILSGVLSLMPKVVLAGMLVYLSFYLVDKWSIKLVFQSIKLKGADRKESLINLTTIATVTLSMIVLGIFWAVAIGFILSIVMFMLRMGKNIIKRNFTAARVRSNVQRPIYENTILDVHGGKIHVYELEGALFFGTAEKVMAGAMESIEGDAQIIILDFLHISDIDSNGISIIMKIQKMCGSQNKSFFLSSIAFRPVLDQLMENNIACFDTLDDALGRAEDIIIQMNSDAQLALAELTTYEIDCLSFLDDASHDILEMYLSREIYRHNEYIFREGDKGDRIYFVVKGRAHIMIKDSTGAERRVSTLSSGTVFGEMAIIDGGPRSAAVKAEGEVICLVLTKEGLKEIQALHPEIATAVHMGLGKELTKRIRIANNTISVLRT